MPRVTFVPANRVGLALANIHKSLISEITQHVHDSIVDKTPVDTGELRDSYEVRQLSITSDVAHFPYVEYGTENTLPAAMVGRTIAELDTIIDKVITAGLS